MKNKSSIKKTITSEEYGVDYKDHVLKQYEFYLSTAEKVSDRRALTNSFFITVVSALISIVGIIIGFGKNNNLMICMWVITVSLSGMIICYSWYKILKSYRELNRAKFSVIIDMENKLPINIFQDEWDKLEKGKNSKIYTPLTNLEKWVPGIFFIIFLSVFVISILWLI